MLRLFAAIAVPFEVAEQLAPVQSGVPDARWRTDDQLHVTLRFFGEVSETAAEDLDAELARVRGAPFDLALAGAGAFGEGDHQRSIWAGVAESEPLRVLAGRCESAARKAGLKPESRRYHPHVTLAYLRRSAPEVRVAAWIAQHNLLRIPPWRATRFGLYSSWQTPSGSRYDLERDYPLS